MPAQQQQKGDEGSLDFLWMIVLIIGVILITWYFGKSYISAFIYQIKLYEIYAIQFVIGAWNKFASFSYLPTLDIDKLNNLANLIQLKKMPSEINTLIKANEMVGKYLRFPVTLVLLALATVVYFTNTGIKFKTVFTMKKLRQIEKDDWPKIIPVIEKNLVHVNVNNGPWAMSLTPTQFCKKHKIFQEEVKDGKPAAVLVPGAARQVLSMQLGPLWEDPTILPIHMQALFAIFAARANSDASNADKLLDQISASFPSGKLNFDGTKRLLYKHMNSENVLKTVSFHAYVYTVMAAMLETARSAGVLATAEFLWLKPLDRKLWYILNSVGRQTAFPEVSGIFSHWLAERRLGYPLKTPMVEEAVRGLKESLEEVIYDPNEEKQE